MTEPEPEPGLVLPTVPYRRRVYTFDRALDAVLSKLAKEQQ